MVVNLDEPHVIGGKPCQTRSLELWKRDDLIHFDDLAGGEAQSAGDDAPGSGFTRSRMPRSASTSRSARLAVGPKLASGSCSGVTIASSISVRCRSATQDAESSASS